MKNNFKFLVVATVALCIGLSTNNSAISNVPANYKVAVVDVSKVVASSKQVALLKEEQKKKVADLTKFVQTAKENIAKEKDATKKKALETKYTKELASKKAAMEKDYSAKLKAIDKNISNIINTKAKADGYNLVLSKGVVLSGGEDITAQITAALK